MYSAYMLHLISSCTKSPSTRKLAVRPGISVHIHWQQLYNPSIHKINTRFMIANKE